MQLIEGQPLFVPEGPNPASRLMSVEQKARLMQKVAEGIHAAHREGLIHRDIKPVEHHARGRPRTATSSPTCSTSGWRARSRRRPSPRSGLAVGTPNFMAPEQARGETALDRRTDVYGLGATLYALSCGAPPFEGPSSLDVLVKVTEQEAPPLTSVPADLATIVAKCLEKEPAQRYDSARALAEDLGRYLDGEPDPGAQDEPGLPARQEGAEAQESWWRRAPWPRWPSCALAAVSVRAQTAVAAARASGRRVRAGGQGHREPHAHRPPAPRARHPAGESGHPPAHGGARGADAEPRERQRKARATTRSAAATWRSRSTSGRASTSSAPGARAIGSARSAYALGQVMGALYQRELELRGASPTSRGARQRKTQVEREYREPALAYLQQSRGLDMESPEYVEGLIAFYEKRYDDSLKSARAASAGARWLYEAKELEARVHTATGVEASLQGRFDAAGEAFRQAEAAYQAALSDPNNSSSRMRSSGSERPRRAPLVRRPPRSLSATSSSAALEPTSPGFAAQCVAPAIERARGAPATLAEWPDLVEAWPPALPGRRGRPARPAVQRATTQQNCSRWTHQLNKFDHLRHPRPPREAARGPPRALLSEGRFRPFHLEVERPLEPLRHAVRERALPFRAPPRPPARRIKPLVVVHEPHAEAAHHEPQQAKPSGRRTWPACRSRPSRLGHTRTQPWTAWERDVAGHSVFW